MCEHVLALAMPPPPPPAIPLIDTLLSVFQCDDLYRLCVSSRTSFNCPASSRPLYASVLPLHPQRQGFHRWLVHCSSLLAWSHTLLPFQMAVYRPCPMYLLQWHPRLLTFTPPVVVTVTVSDLGPHGQAQENQKHSVACQPVAHGQRNEQGPCLYQGHLSGPPSYSKMPSGNGPSGPSSPTSFYLSPSRSTCDAPTVRSR